jgi:hypothetical protein
MTALDTRARATALRLLQKYGKPVTLTQVTEGTYNPATGELSGGGTTIEIPYALIEDFNGKDYISGLIEIGDRKLMTPAQGYAEPELNDRFTVDSDSYTVIAVETIWSGEQAAAYISQIRK